MDSLFSRATTIDVVTRQLPRGEVVHLREVRMSFDRATPDRLLAGTLPPTYTTKPLVTFDGEILFGELAVLRWLQRDGWDGAWVDTFHGRKFWRDMPHRSAPLSLPVHAQGLYDGIVAANGGRGAGFFDVMAWRGTRVVFAEYKGPGDHPNRNEAAWIGAALRTGISEQDLFIVCGLSARSATVTGGLTRASSRPA